MNWYPEIENYDPKLSVEDWKKLLQDETIFSVTDLEIMKRFQHYECCGTYAHLVYAYGEDYFFYKDNIAKLGKKIADKTNCPVYQNHYENIPLLEREASTWAKKYEDDENGKKFYKLRDELATALDFIDLSSIQLFTDKKAAEKVNYSTAASKNEKYQCFNKSSICFYGCREKREWQKTNSDQRLFF